jgi:hypothetical protein
MTGFDSKRQAALDKIFEMQNELSLHYDQRPTMTKDEALKLALEYLGAHKPKISEGSLPVLLHNGAITTLKEALAQPEQEPVVIDGNTSDGYHTFNELYEFRKAYNAALFNEWAVGGKCSVHKSWRHHDGDLCFGGGWFIVVAFLPNGQISNHYEAKDWDLFAVPETERSLFEFDGHTSSDVVARLKAYTTPPKRPWVGLTDDEIKEIIGLYGDTPIKGYTRKLFDQIEAALRSKNT